jgi:hypothetical protein
MKRWVCALALLSTPAWAWPVDVVQDLEVGKEKFVRLSSLDWFEVEDPKVATVEFLESGEILFTPLKPGRTLVLMYAEKKFAVWRLRVAGKPVEAQVPPLLKACPKLEHHPDAYDKLVGPVADDKCRTALLTALANDSFLAKELDLTFEPVVLQAQLKSMEAAFAAAKVKIAARYEGASLILSGSVSAAEHRKALWEVFRRSAGRVAMEDQIEVAPEPAGDAGK